PGVARQWCGRLGKTDNCVVTVHMGVSRGRFKALLGGALFLPKEWSDDRARCRAAGIPDNLVHRPKWQIALEQIDQATANGVALDWLTFDEEYGKAPPFAAGLCDRQLRFVGGGPRSLPSRLAAGPAAPLPDDEAEPAECLLVAALGGQAVAVRVAREHTADVVWQAAERQVWLRQGQGWSARPYRLIVAYN